MSPSDPVSARPVPAEFAHIAHLRLRRALQAYRALADRWDATEPLLVDAADLALDAAIAVEAACKAVVDDLGVPVCARRTDVLVRAILARPDAPPALAAAGPALADALATVRDARHRYVHAGLPVVGATDLLAAVRVAIRTVLLLASAYEILARGWPEVLDTLWAFDGQPAHFAQQVRRHYASRRIAPVTLVCHLRRFTGGTLFRLRGALHADAALVQPHWGRRGSAARLAAHAPGEKAVVDAIPLPETGDARSASGEQTHAGTLELHVRDVAVSVDVVGAWDTGLAAPIFLRPGRDDAWMVGPGELRLTELRLAIPYRAHSRWFVTPDGRQEVCAEIVACGDAGAAEGRLAFHHPGHHGRPAYRGEAALDGVVGACRPGGRQLAVWRAVTTEPTGARLASWQWDGVQQLDLQVPVALAIQFGDVDCFDP